MRQLGLTRLVWADYGDGILGCIEHEKRLKRGRRAYTFDLIDRADPDWRDLFDDLAQSPATPSSRP